MARYINLDELLNAIDKRNGRLPLWLDEILMEDCKVADVAPVRHGRWETGYFHDRVCSCCTHPDNDLEERAHRFCPHCGAKMDEESEKNEMHRMS